MRSIDERVISYEQGKILADQYKFQFVETSAKHFVNVNECFFQLTEIILHQKLMLPLKNEFLFIIEGSIENDKKDLIKTLTSGASPIMKDESELFFYDFYINEKSQKLAILHHEYQQNYFIVGPIFLLDINAFIFVYNISNRISFENIKILISYCIQNSSKNVSGILVGIDNHELNTEICFNEGKKIAKRFGLLFAETTPNDFCKVNELFYQLLELVIQKREYPENKSKTKCLVS